MAYFHRVAALLAATLAFTLTGWAAPAAAQRYDSGLLWRVEKGGAVPSHVFGTIHLADSRVTQLPPAVSDALTRSRSLTVEIGLDSANLVALAGRMVFLDGRDLPGAVGPDLYARTAALAAGLGLPETAVRLFKPWAIAMLLSVPPQDPKEVLDFVLVATAREQGKPVHELESLEEQIGIFEAMPEPDQAVFLRRAVDSYEQMPRLVGRLIERYLARDLAGLRRLGEDTAGGDAETRRVGESLLRRLLESRNARMAERMQPQLQEGGAFVAVGALHLPGASGVLAELERRGWRVTRVY